MNELQSMNIEEIVEAFENNSMPKGPLVVRAGNILLDDEGNNHEAELFLMKTLDASTAGGNTTKDIVENCFVFLTAYHHKMRRKTQEVLKNVEDSPPHPGFSLAVEEKLKAFGIAA